MIDNTALQACPFCTEEEQRNDSGRVFFKELPHDDGFLTTLDDTHLQVAHDEKSGWVFHIEDESGDRLFDIKIAYCPICGRSLNRRKPEPEGGAR